MSLDEQAGQKAATATNQGVLERTKQKQLFSMSVDEQAGQKAAAATHQGVLVRTHKLKAVVFL